MTLPFALVFGEDNSDMLAFGETLKGQFEVGYRFPHQLLPNHVEPAEKVFMLKDYPDVKAVYGDKAVLVDAKTSTKSSSKKDA